MKSGFLIWCCIITFYRVKSQRLQVNVCLGAGPQVFLNQPTRKYGVGFTRQTGLTLLIPNNKNAIKARIGAMHLVNNYYSHINLFEAKVRIRQSLLCLHPEALLRLKKHLYLKVGLMTGIVLRDWIELVYKGNATYFSFSNTQLFDGYGSTGLQAAVSGGVCVPFKIKNTELSFDVTLTHHATGIVDKDYNNTLLNGPDGSAIFSSKIRPSTLVMSIAVAIRNQEPHKKKTEEE